jgi:hypothetical protein
MDARSRAAERADETLRRVGGLGPERDPPRPAERTAGEPVGLRTPA